MIQDIKLLLDRSANLNISQVYLGKTLKEVRKELLETFYPNSQALSILKLDGWT